jgi:hypothetical protein
MILPAATNVKPFRRRVFAHRGGNTPPSKPAKMFQTGAGVHCCDRTASENDREMPTSEKDLLAAEAMDRWEDFQEGLSSEKRKYPIQQFRAFWSAATRYAELTKSDSMIHKRLAAAVNGLVDFLGAERKRVPDDVLRDAERLETLIFRGYDPSFAGDEPPAL